MVKLAMATSEMRSAPQFLLAERLNLAPGLLMPIIQPDESDA